jgi:hypothetical protein
MPESQLIIPIVKAHQWFKNGDHPDDESTIIESPGDTILFSEGKVVRRFRHPYTNGKEDCLDCGRKYNEHGWIDELLKKAVCPGDWIITLPSGLHYALSAEFYYQCLSEEW